VDSEREREQIYEDFIIELKRKEKEKSRVKKKELMEKFERIMRSVGAFRPPLPFLVDLTQENDVFPFFLLTEPGSESGYSLGEGQRDF